MDSKLTHQPSFVFYYGWCYCKNIQVRYQHLIPRWCFLSRYAKDCDKRPSTADNQFESVRSEINHTKFEVTLLHHTFEESAETARAFKDSLSWVKFLSRERKPVILQNKLDVDLMFDHLQLVIVSGNGYSLLGTPDRILVALQKKLDDLCLVSDHLPLIHQH